MKKYKDVTRPVRVDRLLSQTVCDVCGRESTQHQEGWKTGSYDATEVEVRLRTGNSYPEGGSGEEWEVDICPTCFNEKLIPWVEAFGHTTIEPTRWDW